MRAVGYDSFKSSWQQCIPQTKFMTARIDVCYRGEGLGRRAVSAGDEEKLAASQPDHVHQAQQEREREFYLNKTREAKA